jgi:hypothetical protein
MINVKVLFLVKPIDMGLFIDIRAVSTVTLSLHLCVQILFTEHITNLALGTACLPFFNSNRCLDINSNAIRACN